MLRLAFDGLTATGTGPLLSLAVGAAGLILLSLILLIGRYTLPAGLAFTAGVVLAGMAVVGTYIGRLYHQARHRPTYLIAEIISPDTPPQPG